MSLAPFAVVAPNPALHIPLLVASVKVVNVALLGVTLPMGGGEARLPLPELASTYDLLAASVEFCGVGTAGETLKVCLPLQVLACPSSCVPPPELARNCWGKPTR